MINGSEVISKKESSAGVSHLDLTTRRSRVAARPRRAAKSRFCTPDMPFSHMGYSFLEITLEGIEFAIKERIEISLERTRIDKYLSKINYIFFMMFLECQSSALTGKSRAFALQILMKIILLTYLA